MSDVYVSDQTLANRFGVHRSTLWRWAKTDPHFPKPLTLTPGCTRWRLSEIAQWEASREKGRAT